ncbi:MAG: FAD:protein FMN transferase [Oscillospiraceae bacterium]|nr:FAD:protein FMN transferase [Oscillospiraceae bacterium]
MAERFHRAYHIVKGIISAVVSAALLCSCTNNSSDKTAAEEASSQSFIFDTYAQFTVCGGEAKNTIDEIETIFGDMSAAFDLCYDIAANELPENSLYEDCLNRTQELNRLYGNGINVFCGSLTELWGISTDSPRVPSDSEISGVLDSIPDVFSETVPDGVKLDFGAVSKGYACDRAFEFLKETDAEYAVISFSSSTLMYGAKPDGKPFRTGLTNPLTGEGYAGIIETESAFISTSGGYERYFVPENGGGKVYCHIMDITTGRPADTDLASATVIVPSDTPNGGIMTDFLATMIFTEGSKSLDRWLACEEFQIVAITTDGRVFSNCDGLTLNESGVFYYE